MQPDWSKIEAENPGLVVRTARFIGEGWNAWAYLVNDELVFRFPKHAANWEEVEREIAFLRFAADRLPLPVPRYRHVAPGSGAAPHGYAMYGYLRGGRLDLNRLDARRREAAAAALAGFLRALHTLQPTGIALPRDDERGLAEKWRGRTEHEIIPRVPHLRCALQEAFETYLGAPENFSFMPAVLHADLSRNHVLMDEAGTVAGVIDFGDVNWGDPDYDFTNLFLDFGPSFAEDVARHYGHADLTRLRPKLRFFAIVDQIEVILDGGGYALDGQEEAAWTILARFLE